MLFVDGVGIGKKDYEYNPFFKYGFNTFEKLFGEIPHLEKQRIEKNGMFLFPCDTRLGVEGLPQSGTGQVSIFCGVNAAKFVGKHFGPFPYSTTIPIIAEQNIFKYYKDLNLKAYFANAYPKSFFDYIDSGKSRLNVTALCCKFANIKLNTSDDIENGNAITAEITNERWNKKLNSKLKILKPETAARRLLKIAANNDFTLHEFYLTDHLGHGRIKDEFDNIYKNLDLFLFTILNEMDKEKLTLVLCSDHGNLEDLSVKTHTMNPAITITAGKNADKLAENIKDLTDIKQSIIKFYT